MTIHPASADPGRPCARAGIWLAIPALLVWFAGAQAGPLVPDWGLAAGTNLFGDFPEDLRECSAFALADAEPTMAARYGQALFFHDGRRLHGELVEIAEDTIVWQRPDAREPLRFPRAEVRCIDLALAEKPRAPATADSAPPTPVPATLKVAGVDWLFGQVTSPDGRDFILQLEDGTRVPLLRTQIEWIYFGPEPAPAAGFSRSPLDVAGWHSPAANGEVRGGILRVTGVHELGHEFAMPKRFEVAFELPAESEEGAWLWLQSDEPGTNFFTGSLEVRVSQGRILCQIDDVGPTFEIPPLPPGTIAGQGPVGYRVFYDGIERRIHVWRSGREIADWKLPLVNPENPQAPEKQIRRVCFSHVGLPLPPWGLEFNRLRVQPWNGVLPRPNGTDATHDLLTHGAAAPVAGTLESVTEKTLVFSGKAQPRAAGAFVEFPNNPFPLANAEARLLLGREGEFNVRRLEIRHGQMRGETAFAAVFQAPARSITSILFPSEKLPAQPSEDVLVFKNGDELAGHALSATLSGPVRWKLASGQEVEFVAEHITGLRLAARAEGGNPGMATAELRTGERLRGKLVSFDENHLRLQSDTLGPITLDRVQLARIYPNTNGQIDILDGARFPESWMPHASADTPAARNVMAATCPRWTYVDGTYLLRSFEDQSINTADAGIELRHTISPIFGRFEFRCELATPLGVSGLVLWLFQQKRDPEPALLADIAVTGTNLHINNADKPGDADAAGLDGIDPAKSRHLVRLFVDVTAATLDLFLDGKSAGHCDWKKARRKIGIPWTVSIQPVHDGSLPTILSHLWIGPWSGELPRPAPGAAVGTSLSNRDWLPGAPRAWHDGKWEIEGELGPMEFPDAKIVGFDFGTAPVEEQSAGRIRLRDGTTLNVDAWQYDGRELTAHHPFLGDLHVPAQAVAELIFSPASLSSPVVAPPPKQRPKDPATPSTPAKAKD